MQGKKRLLLCWLIVTTLTTSGWFFWGSAGAVAQGAQQTMAQMMEMMRQKMMNRPDAMKQADESIQNIKLRATQQGRYVCCLKNACDSCALKMGECPCGMNAAQDLPVCNECKGGWYAGNGAISGKTPEQIRTLPRPLAGM